MQINHLLQSLISSGNELPKVTTLEVGKYIKSLKNNKASDIFGITSEHLKYDSHPSALPKHHNCNWQDTRPAEDGESVPSAKEEQALQKPH